MKFYCINAEGRNPRTVKSLNEECSKKDIDFVELLPNKFDYKIIENLKDDDVVLRINDSYNARVIESIFLAKGLRSVYRNSTSKMFGRFELSALDHYLNKIKSPKTVFRNTSDKKYLQGDVNYLGGLPIIVKVLGGTGGVGVIKADSFDSLLSICDYLIANNQKYILRELIDTKIYGRLVVLDDKVIASKRNDIPDSDFRSNNGNAEIYEFSNEVKNEAVNALKCSNYIFGGVDVLIDQNDDLFITEINTPCNYINTQETTGVNISEKLIESILLKK